MLRIGNHKYAVLAEDGVLEIWQEYKSAPDVRIIEFSPRESQGLLDLLSGKAVEQTLAPDASQESAKIIDLSTKQFGI